jgi:hypothetical protein
MKKANFHGYHIRKWYAFIDESLANETGVFADGDGKPVRKVAVAAVIGNPYAGKFSEDLGLIVKDSAALGEEFGRRLVAILGGEKARSYGKGCIVGTAGEYEHGNAFLTTDFADPIRAAFGGGKSWIPSTGKTGGAGTTIDIPLASKDALYVRAQYNTFTLTFPDAPAPDEVVVIFAAATRGRIKARLGGLLLENVIGQDGLR